MIIGEKSLAVAKKRQPKTSNPDHQMGIRLCLNSRDLSRSSSIFQLSNLGPEDPSENFAHFRFCLKSWKISSVEGNEHYSNHTHACSILIAPTKLLSPQNLGPKNILSGLEIVMHEKSAIKWTPSKMKSA